MVLGYSLADYLFTVENTNRRSIEVILKGTSGAVYATGMDSFVVYPDIRMSDSDIVVSAGTQVSSMSDDMTGDGYLVNYGYSSVELIDLVDKSSNSASGVLFGDFVDVRNTDKHVESISGVYNRTGQRLTIGSDPYNTRFNWLGSSKTDRILLEPLAGTITTGSLNVTQSPVDDAFLNRSEKQLDQEPYTVALKTIDPRIEIGDNLQLFSDTDEFGLDLGKKTIVTSFTKNFNTESGDVSMEIQANAIVAGVTINNTLNVRPDTQ
jgi:hypothetical protein